ncbi:hypothetical protein BDV95DRAFT_592650 [Massariosphaeria phaeospora]|uniref:Uncharacterized protein n=1 Tax=Massariosphaeria phaeospora TaxID=100035 RepID=A0A7C8MJ55_9PLEO|nr:hypothetical protein BDV95DRAFT_592650 [Massariosphaeria phaeospora]
MPADGLESAPMSPWRASGGLWSAVLQWAMSRRGRMVLFSSVFVFVLLAVMGARSSETITSRYQSLSSDYHYHLPSWRPHLPNLPSIIASPLKPSSTTIELENGEIKYVPVGLTKATPNFHLLMPALDDSPEFCKTTLSAMLLNYPPPTIINLYQKFASQADREQETLRSTLHYLSNKKLVKDEDMVLIVDGHDTWFQLPSDVMIRQYQIVLADANTRLMTQYGNNTQNVQKHNQTILFGAAKVCKGDDLACKQMPDSVLPSNIYGTKTGKEIALTPAKYLDAGTLMGPAQDLKKLFAAAVKKFEREQSQAATVQSIMATIFGEQELARRNEHKGTKPASSSKWVDWFGGQAGEPEDATPKTNADQENTWEHEFAIGLDYTHTLFQSVIYSAEDELVPLPHDNSTDLSKYHHDGTPTPALKIPTALQRAKPPFWTPDLSNNNPSPNEKPAYIDKLEFDKDIDHLKPRDTKWEDINLIQNTYTGAIAAALHLNVPLTKTSAKAAAHEAGPSANLSYPTLWHAPYSRALLRKYIRARQSPLGAHAAAVGGDRQWDQRGGRGGIWTEAANLWLPWGEVDGVCGALQQLKDVFADDKGVWLHEKEQDAEKKRLEEEQELRDRIVEEAKKQEEDEEKKRKKKEKEEKMKKAKEDGGQKKARRRRVWAG